MIAVKTDIQHAAFWNAYGVLCLLVARDVNNGYIETVDNLVYRSTGNSVGTWTPHSIQQHKTSNITLAYSIDSDGYLVVTLSAGPEDYFTNFSMCLISF